MLSADELRAAVELVRELTFNRKAKASANLLGRTPPSSNAPKIIEVTDPLPVYELTQDEIADYLDRAGWDSLDAKALVGVEHAVDFGDGLSSQQAKVIADLILNTADSERATLQLDTIALVARWLLRNGEAVGPDGRTIVGVRTLKKAKRVVANWIDGQISRVRTERQVTQAAVPVASKPRAGRPPRLDPRFIVLAGTLWLQAQRRRCNQSSASQSASRSVPSVTIEDLFEIANTLDAGKFVPPADYLEKQFAEELKSYNSRNSRSKKTGPIKTWGHMVRVGDKDHLRGMRRLLSRCAKRLDDPSVSGN